MTRKLKMQDMVGNEEQEQYTNIINNDHRETNDEISMLAIKELLSKKKLKTISRVKIEQVPIIAKLYLFDNMFNDSFTRKLADLILQLQISTNGLGRRELVQLVQQRNDFGDMMTNTKSKDIFR